MLVSVKRIADVERQSGGGAMDTLKFKGVAKQKRIKIDGLMPYLV